MYADNFYKWSFTDREEYFGLELKGIMIYFGRFQTASRTDSYPSSTFGHFTSHPSATAVSPFLTCCVLTLANKFGGSSFRARHVRHDRAGLM